MRPRFPLHVRQSAPCGRKAGLILRCISGQASQFLPGEYKPTSFKCHIRVRLPNILKTGEALPCRVSEWDTHSLRQRTITGEKNDSMPPSAHLELKPGPAETRIGDIAKSACDEAGIELEIPERHAILRTSP